MCESDRGAGSSECPDHGRLDSTAELATFSLIVRRGYGVSTRAIASAADQDDPI